MQESWHFAGTNTEIWNGAPPRGTIRINIAVELLQPLLKADLTEHLFANRGPLELALDAMTFDILEPTLYRYILDRGGLTITPAEFRQFLLPIRGNYFSDIFHPRFLPPFH